MRDPYQVLGVSPGAPDEEVKRAFRRLAKELHPDLHPNDPAADRAFRDVTSAYQTLGDRRSRMAHDAAVANDHHSLRRRFRASAVTTLTVFALTVFSVSVAVLWQDFVKVLASAGDYARERVGAARPTSFSPDGTSHPAEGSGSLAIESAEVPAPSPLALASVPERPSVDNLGTRPLPEDRPAAPLPLPSAGLADNDGASYQPDDGGKRRLPAATESPGTGPLGDDVRERVPSAPDQASTWASYRSATFGFALQYPVDVFVSDPSPSDEGKSFLSRDGRARLVISAASNTNGATLTKHRQSLMEGTYKGAVFDYTPQRSNWFVLSGTLGAEMFYQRVTLSCDGRTLHWWKLIYPILERAFYDRIVEEMHRRYRHGNGPGGRCGEAGASQRSRPDGNATALQ
jgi:hypothetical protein